MSSNAVLYATLRLKRKPISNDIVCFKLRVAHALPVHTYALHEEDISDRASGAEVQRVLDALRQRYKCGTVELDAKRDVLKRIEANG